MNFKQLVLYMEAMSSTGRPPGIAHLMPFGFKGTVDDFFYCRFSKSPGVNIPADVSKRIAPILEEEERFIRSTNIERLPTPEEKKRLSDAIIELQRRNPVLGNIISLMPVIYTGSKREGQKVSAADIRTFAVDAKGNLLINLGYANLCSFEQLIGVLAHEAMHVSLAHHERLRSRKPFVYANIATDALINNELISDGYEVGYGMGVFARGGKITVRIMYVDYDVPDIKTANPREYQVVIDISNKTWEQLFDIIKDLLNRPDTWQQITFKVGDVIYDKTKKSHGVITNVSQGLISIREITEQEAKELTKNKVKGIV